MFASAVITIRDTSAIFSMDIGFYMTAVFSALILLFVRSSGPLLQDQCHPWLWHSQSSVGHSGRLPAACSSAPGPPGSWLRNPSGTVGAYIFTNIT